MNFSISNNNYGGAIASSRHKHTKKMTVSELIEKLRQFDGDMEVKTAAQSGDYWGTLLANDIHDVDVVNVTNSDYHRTCKVIDDDKIDNYDESEIKQVVLI